ncbi:uncharacterized protein LOC116118305 isoform X2 [Pistacia vera]|uniref:uncharacterized protein LOC116118305 isoform X2 n=1 Tax=Pistacia vera TaxID=55513 RepID=UPI001263BD22|nr:uncharacterized protein LOC116118305 isoform X2 [Pistacia vera]
MLQWMGGSRRKVASSRKSTQKRQKQYFEQRKRQQQQTVGLDISVDHKQHRSLDVLSLLNLSTSSQQHYSVCPNGRQDLEVNASSEIFINTATAEDFVEVKESGTQLRYQMETVYLKNASCYTPDYHSNASTGDNCKTDLWNTTSQYQTSVFDLLAEDGPSGNMEGSPIHEAHVAFSVEGLGKVGTQTPVHSPQPERYSSPRKAARRHNSKNLDYVLDDLELEVDVMMEDLSVPLGGSNLEFSTGITNSCSNQKQKYSVFSDCTPFEVQVNKMKRSFNDSSIFCGIGNNNDDLWDVQSSVLEEDFLCEKKHDVSGKIGHYQTERIDFMKYGNNEMSNYVFEKPHSQKNRDSVEAAGTYNILDSPFQKHQISGNNDDFITSKRTGYPAVGRNFDFKKVITQPGWSYSEDAKDNLSLLSEESCSSSAVRGEATDRSPPNSTARECRRRHKNAVDSHVDIYGSRNIYAKQSQAKNIFDVQKESSIRGSGKCTRMPMPTTSKLKYFHHSNSCFHDKSGQLGSWLFEHDTISGVTTSQTSDTKVPASRSKPEMGDPFGGFRVHESYIDAKSSLGESRCGESVKCSPFESSISEKFTCRKPFSYMNHQDSSNCSKVELRPTKPNLSLDSLSRDMPQASFPVASSDGEILFLNLLAQENVSKYEETKSKPRPANHDKFESGKQSCSWNNYILSENKTAMDALNSKDKILECSEAEDGTLELKESPETANSLEHAEETSSSVKIPDKVEDSINHEYKNSMEIHLPCQNENKDLDGSGPEESKRQGIGANSSSSVVMLESYVLQILCMQEVEKDVSGQGSLK